MLAIFGTVFGFMAPFLPELLKYFTRKQDNAQEIALMKLRMEAAGKEHMYKMEEITATADIAETVELHKPQQSFGVQLLDAAKGRNLGQWAIAPAFYLFVLLDFVSGMVRPAITYAAMAFYISYKSALFYTMQSVSDESFNWHEGIRNLWTPDDLGVLMTCLAFWFGNRVVKAAFGGNASTGKPGA